MKAAILWSKRARLDLLEIGDFIARDRPQAAAAWVGRILDAVNRLNRQKDHPFRLHLQTVHHLLKAA